MNNKYAAKCDFLVWLLCQLRNGFANCSLKNNEQCAGNESGTKIAVYFCNKDDNVTTLLNSVPLKSSIFLTAFYSFILHGAKSLIFRKIIQLFHFNEIRVSLVNRPRVYQLATSGGDRDRIRVVVKQTRRLLLPPPVTPRPIRRAAEKECEKCSFSILTLPF